MPRRNQKPYWLDTALTLRRDGYTLKRISERLNIPISTVRYQLSISLNPEQYDKYCKEPSTPDGRRRTKKILALLAEGFNGNQIAQLVGVSRQYVYKLLRLKKEQKDKHLDYVVNKTLLEKKGTKTN
jgi:DNA-binding CsgD family transcriptional regulator